MYHDDVFIGEKFKQTAKSALRENYELHKIVIDKINNMPKNSEHEPSENCDIPH